MRIKYHVLNKNNGKFWCGRICGAKADGNERTEWICEKCKKHLLDWRSVAKKSLKHK